MSQGDRSERVGFLRAAIARIEAGGAAAMGGAQAAGPSFAPSSAPSSAPEGADWAGAAAAAAAARGLFCEVAPAAAHDHGAASGFALALAARCAREAGGPVAWIAEDFAFLEWGAPYGPGLAAYGLGWRDLTLLRLPRRADVWLASEEAIRARVFAAIVVEPAALAGAEAPKVLRRLAMGARMAGARAILLRPPVCARTPFLAPSSLRFEVAARCAPRPAAGRRPLPGQGAWRVRCAAPAGRLAPQTGDVFRDVDLAPVDPLVPQDLASVFPSPFAAQEDFIGVALSLPSSAGLAGRAA